MATFYKCDRCHNISTNREKIFYVEIPVVQPYKSEMWKTNKDFCISCLQ